MSLTLFEVYCSLYKLQFQKLHTNVRSCPNLQHFVQVDVDGRLLPLPASPDLAGIVPGHFTYGGQVGRYRAWPLHLWRST